MNFTLLTAVLLGIGTLSVVFGTLLLQRPREVLDYAFAYYPSYTEPNELLAVLSKISAILFIGIGLLALGIGILLLFP